MLISIADAAKSLSVGRSTLYRLIDRGQLAVVKIGRRTLVRVSSIEALVNKGDTS